MNACYDNCEVPEIWRRRLVRALAKTEDAVGLEGIRPIALLEVGQKIMTGILTARLSEVWNKHETLHPSQMAFLFGRGCHQALERVRGVMLDAKSRNKELHMLFLDLAKAYDSVEYWAMDVAMRGLGVPEKLLDFMNRLDEGAKGKVLIGGAAQETGWIKFGRGAPQGEVMSPLRFIAWINLLNEVLAERPNCGYSVELEGGIQKYTGHVFCDDGWFAADTKEDLQEIAEIVSAFCEIFKVKINAGKSYYTCNRPVGEGQRELRLWDHTAAGGEGQWEQAKYVTHNTAVRYLGVMVAADGNAVEQTRKVQREIDRVLDKIEQGHCSMEIANYLLQACVGGLLNYHGPFTNISDSMVEAWDRRIREILRKKGRIAQSTAVSFLHDKKGVGLGWFSARRCLNEVVICEGWITLTSAELEGCMVREQVRVANRERGTIYSPLTHPQSTQGGRGMKVWHTVIQNMESRLADIGMFMDTDVLRPGREIAKCSGEDIPLQLVQPELTQRQFQGERLTMLQSAAQQGWVWVSQFVDEQGRLKRQPEALNGRPIGTKRRRAWERWVQVLSTEEGAVKPAFDPRVPEARAQLEADRDQDNRQTEYTFTEATALPKVPILHNESNDIVYTSDGSFKVERGSPRAAVATRAVQNANGQLLARLVGTQAIAKAELIGGYGGLAQSVPLLQSDKQKEFHGFLDNQGIKVVLQNLPHMTDRQIKRSKQGGSYLRIMRAWMQDEDMADRIHWHWMKSHTARKGPLHCTHNWCDEACGRAREKERPQQRRFIEGDWEFVLCYKEG